MNNSKAIIDSNIDNPLYRRIERIRFFYKNYLLENNLEEALVDLESSEFNFSTDQKAFINDTLTDKEMIEDELKKHLPKDWKWERFNFLERAILVNGASEIIKKENKKDIVINESIEFARKYCGIESEPLINGILDKIESK